MKTKYGLINCKLMHKICKFFAFLGFLVKIIGCKSVAT